MLLVAVRRVEVYRVFDLIHACDPDAFVMVTDAGDITGQGFRRVSP